MTPDPWLVIAGCAAVTFAIKAAGPVALGGRTLPSAFSRVISLMAPTLLAALIATAALADGKRITAGAETAGVAFAALVMWRTQSIIATVFAAAAVTAALRAIT